MGLTVAVLGAGRMGAFVGKQLPGNVKKMIIDSDLPKAEALAAAVGGTAAATLAAAREADVIAVVLPAPAVNPAVSQLAAVAGDGAIIMNMATSADIDGAIIQKYPALRFVEAKIIGHAGAIKQGAPCCVVVNTDDAAALEKIRYVLSGYQKVVTGDVSLVPLINTVGSGEGIRAAVNVRRQLKKYNIPREWEDIVIYTVCAGTMRSYVENDLGEFAQKLAERLEAETE